MHNPEAVKLTPEQMIEAIPKDEQGYPRRVPQTPCWIARCEGGGFKAMIPVPVSSTAQTRAWEDMCHKFVKAWLKNQPELVEVIEFVLMPESSSALATAQQKRDRRAQRHKTKIL